MQPALDDLKGVHALWEHSLVNSDRQYPNASLLRRVSNTLSPNFGDKWSNVEDQIEDEFSVQGTVEERDSVQKWLLIYQESASPSRWHKPLGKPSGTC